MTAVFVQPQMHPAIAICIFAPLLLPGDLVYNRLIWVTDGSDCGYRRSTHSGKRQRTCTSCKPDTSLHDDRLPHILL